MYLRKKDIIFITFLSLLFVFGSIIGWLIIHTEVFIFSLGIVAVLLLLIQIRVYRTVQAKLKQQSWNSYQQIQSLFSVFSSLKVRYPLPPMRGYAISPDFATIIISLIQELKPQMIVEAGSGVSTLIAAYSVREVGEGKVLSLEHDERFAAKSAVNVKKHGLEDVANVVYAPLKKFAIGDKSWLWYDTEQVRNVGSIDLLIIDGPPAITQKLARYPALPILFNQLSDNAVILLDDLIREDEKEIIKLWLREFGGFDLEECDVEKGAAILRRQISKAEVLIMH